MGGTANLTPPGGGGTPPGEEDNMVDKGCQSENKSKGGDGVAQLFNDERQTTSYMRGNKQADEKKKDDPLDQKTEIHTYSREEPTMEGCCPPPT